MRPEDPLTIWEIRSEDEAARAALEPGPLKAGLAAALGPQAASSLLGLHLEADFAFLFFDSDLDPGPWLAGRPGLSLREVHRLRYDQWQDGAHSRPISLGPLQVLPASAAGGLKAESGSGPPPLAGFPGEPWGAVKGPPEAGAGPAGAASQARPARLAPLVIDPGLAFGFGGHPTT
jgi:hypothetical protein